MYNLHTFEEGALYYSSQHGSRLRHQMVRLQNHANTNFFLSMTLSALIKLFSD